MKYWIRSSWTSLEGEERLGRPSMSATSKSVEWFWKSVHKDCWRTIKDNADSIEATLISDMNMYCIATETAPRILAPEEKVHHVELQDIHQLVLDNQPFVYGVNTMVMTWRSNNSLHRPRAHNWGAWVQPRAWLSYIWHLWGCMPWFCVLGTRLCQWPVLL